MDRDASSSSNEETGKQGKTVSDTKRISATQVPDYLYNRLLEIRDKTGVPLSSILKVALKLLIEKYDEDNKLPLI